MLSGELRQSLAKEMTSHQVICMTHRAISRTAENLRFSSMLAGVSPPKGLRTLDELEGYLFYCTRYPEVWDRVGEALKESFQVEDDSDWTDAVYNYVRSIALEVPSEGAWVH